jgi:LPXTG-site transpeptidase (sortase) family protein
MAVPASSSGADDPRSTVQGSGSGLTVLCTVALLFLAMLLIGGNNTASPGMVPTPQIQPALQAPQAASSAPGDRTPAEPLPRSRPVRLLIPKISVDAPFTDLAIGPTGQLQPPPATDTNLVGWHADGPSPGEAGTAVIAGHVDTATSAAVFVYLSRLAKGDVFQVLRADGRTASFVVDSVETFAKDDFPSDRVYGDTPDPQVRLITCAGDYDRTVRDYKDNLVVFAHLT